MPWKFTNSYLTRKENLTGNSCEIEFKVLRYKDIALINFPAVKTFYDIYYGKFEGISKDCNNEEYVFKDVYGIIEDKFTIW